MQREREREGALHNARHTHIVFNVHEGKRNITCVCVSLQAKQMAARVGVSKPVGESSKGRRRAAVQQTSRGTLSVKEMSEELERARQNEVSMRNKLHAVSESHTCSYLLTVVSCCRLLVFTTCISSPVYELMVLPI